MHYLKYSKKISILCTFAVVFSLFSTGCSQIMGKVKDDPTVTGETERLKTAGLNYTGPQYTIGIIKLRNKTPSKVLGIGEAATTILRTLLKEAGLEPVMLTKDAIKDIDEMIELQQSGIVKMGKKDAAEGGDSIDFRFSGAITSYSENVEGKNMVITTSKSYIARVGVDYALVDIATLKTLVVGSGMGEYRKRTRKVLGFGSSSGGDESVLRDGALRDAMTKAVRKMILKLSERPFQSKILMLDGDRILFKAGRRSKLEPGTRLTVYRQGKDLIDPDTGRSLGKSTKKIGMITLSSHQSNIVSDGSISSGSDFRRGDVLKIVR